MVSKSLQGNGKTCPLCRETITLCKIYTNLAVRAMIAKILVCSINSGCTWTGEHDKMQNHSAICPFKIVSCPNGCQESYRQDAMDLHLAACPFQEFKCSFCNVKVLMLKCQDSISTLTLETVRKVRECAHFTAEMRCQGRGCG